MLLRKHQCCWPLHPSSSTYLSCLIYCCTFCSLFKEQTVELSHAAAVWSEKVNVCNSAVNSHRQGDFQEEPVRLPKVTAEHLRLGANMENESRKIKEGIAWMRFIHLNKVDHQSDVAAELLVRQEKRSWKTDRERGTG